ncbi:30S ribosomal protein S3 [Candidatus Legionella polyplacis]|uniref:30S ribosomal protein S3 n=1 Tax=Candidatus Legionella polyplacis TaxID=2005262 RepID=UPI000C1F6BBD|nr:30S ribosomal protein S3 [Candidatus Legionella polyplacis]ATW01761.1 30S ribosomal protein S3 [Candidatus Legionella polyplacis]
MGQKVNPIGIRLGIIQDWNSKWYSNKYYSSLLNQDINLRKYLKKKLNNAFVSKICIERPAKNAVITIYTARPGVIIGKKGGGIENLRKDIESYLGIPVKLNIEEIKHPELDPVLISENIAQQLEQRVMFRRIMRKSINSAIKSGAKGIKICISGRLGGSEIARSECYREGRIPLHTFRANIGYGLSEAKTTYGMIGVKVWVFSGEIYNRKVIK